jgi:hypothetical protein
MQKKFPRFKIHLTVQLRNFHETIIGCINLQCEKQKREESTRILQMPIQWMCAHLKSYVHELIQCLTVSFYVKSHFQRLKHKISLQTSINKWTFAINLIIRNTNSEPQLSKMYSKRKESHFSHWWTCSTRTCIQLLLLDVEFY